MPPASRRQWSVGIRQLNCAGYGGWTVCRILRWRTNKAFVEHSTMASHFVYGDRSKRCFDQHQRYVRNVANVVFSGVVCCGVCAASDRPTFIVATHYDSLQQRRVVALMLWLGTDEATSTARGNTRTLAPRWLAYKSFKTSKHNCGLDEEEFLHQN